MPRKLRVQYPGAIYHLMNRLKVESCPGYDAVEPFPLFPPTVAEPMVTGRVLLFIRVYPWKKFA
jgi:hypothetical protein